jgi:hypothetical protein
MGSIAGSGPRAGGAGRACKGCARDVQGVGERTSYKWPESAAAVLSPSSTVRMILPRQVLTPGPT